MKKKSNLLVNIVIVISIVGAIVQLYLSTAHDMGQPAFSLVFLSIPVMISRLKQYKEMASSSEEGAENFRKSVKVGLIGGIIFLFGIIIFTVIAFMLLADPVPM